MQEAKSLICESCGRVKSAGRKIGSKKKDGKGYKYIFVGPEFEGAAPSGWIFEHRLVIQQVIGRPLLKSEIVHHKDRNPANNDPSNLELCASPRDHGILHMNPPRVHVHPGTGNRISKQRFYQLKNKAAGKCTKCGKDSIGTATFCLRHLIAVREQSRRNFGCKRRNTNAFSYKITLDTD